MINRSVMQAPEAKDLSADTISPVRAARRLKVVQAAEAVFASHGFRGTSMEAIAEAAGMSKVTIYGYFRDKEAVFTAVAEHLADRLKQAAEAALAQEGGVADRVAGALIAKHSIVYHLVRRSSHAADLFHAKDAHAATFFAAIDRDIQDRLADALLEEGHTLNTAQQTARILFAAANGIAAEAISAEQLAEDIRALVSAVLAQKR
ncbi:TetR/AcrR family transcriptional regulator [Aquidulcibacter sp.]|uniref:TetR/AcrR family transcriptional regulator n=1 Tax=Aquidulcibacter sp. TaxID=2052990 RepID=UPI0025BCDEF6|nr:TetR/AcrR family transcriptional regulator [Aquidulcibacter sp.]MCA3698083.1 TetR/AcrR family transcriptional regulator [Aquidulcibacter sp.]